MFSSTPASIPKEWRRDGAKQLAKAVGFGAKPGSQAQAADIVRQAYIWYDGDEEHSLSFAESHSRAADLAAIIRAVSIACGVVRKVDADDSSTCGLLLSRTASMPLAQLAAFKAGSTFVPCDPTWPVARTADILSEACACVVITDLSAEQMPQLTAGLFKAGGGPASIVVRVDDSCRVIEHVLSRTLEETLFWSMRDAVRNVLKFGEIEWEPPEVMYIMYTSGSTGKPKGCAVPTEGVWHRFKWGTKLLGFRQQDVFVLKTPYTFDCSIPEMWVPMYLGCTSIIVPDGGHLDFELVRTTMERGLVTVAHFVPSVLALFLDFVEPGSLINLRQISCTGEALLLSHRDKLTRKLGHALPLFNLYGPTEAAIEVTYFEATHDVAGLTHGFPIGYAGDDGVLMYVVDPSEPTKLMPEGEKGEVCIGGRQVAYGYVNRPELNAEKFLNNPHGTAGLMYRTGDLGRRDPVTGWLEYLGRADRQVKLGGVRMELGEIEAVALELFPSLLSLAVEVVSNKLVGVYAPQPGMMPPSAKEVQSRLSGALPSSYVPTEWYVRDALPLGSAGKVDHKKVVAWIKDQSKAALWGSIYDELYFADQLQVDGADADPTMDWAAYTDSFTGEMHERPTICEWVDETVAEILELGPSSVIEMGCGKGMILFKVASDVNVRSYVGCDLSRLAIAHVERVWASSVSVGPGAPKCALSTHVRDASNFGGLPDGGTSAVVVNGVSMYFPSATYLLEVLQNGLPKIAPAGCLHFGDVISLPHYELFLLRKARLVGGASYADLQTAKYREQLVAVAKDRCFHHELFYALMLGGRLPGVAAIETQLKRGSIMSEFTRYRYNVQLHLGKPVQPARLVAAPDSTVHRAPAEIAREMAEIATSEATAVVVCRGIANARLTADVLLRDGKSDAVAPAVQHGVGDGGGVDPAELREALAAAMPSHHIVLTWARDGRADRMDAYVLPLSPTDSSRKLAGLRAVMEGATALTEGLATRCDQIESFTNALGSVDTEDAAAKEADADAALQAVMSEVSSLWQSGDKKQKEAAVLKLLSAKLGLGEVTATDSFSELGANSFVAMQTIGVIREVLKVSVPVFELLTKKLHAFGRVVVSLSETGTNDKPPQWAYAVGGPSAAQKWLNQETPVPTMVFFPQAGSSPKQYAPVYTKVARLCPAARCIFVNPPGRDARAAEPNETNLPAFVAATVSALRPLLVGIQSLNGSVVFVGDSWGAIAAFAVAHALREQTGFVPDHMLLSGNASPMITSTHGGLGSFCDTPMAQLDDEALAGFLRVSGVEEEEDAVLATLIPSFRADCGLYEQYSRPANLPKLGCGATLMRGAADDVVGLNEMLGWAEEFETSEIHFLQVPGTTHHVHEEEPAYVAERLLMILGEHATGSIVSVPLAAEPTVLTRQLPPPCTFVRGIDPRALQAYREGNLQYRMGSPRGARNEVSSILRSTSSSPPGSPRKVRDLGRSSPLSRTSSKGEGLASLSLNASNNALSLSLNASNNVSPKVGRRI